MTQITGNKNGILLWALMSKSKDPEEQKYYKRCNELATKNSKVYFVDMIAERETKKNQITWRLEWNIKTLEWNINKFISPTGINETPLRLNKVKYE